MSRSDRNDHQPRRLRFPALGLEQLLESGLGYRPQYPHLLRARLHPFHPLLCCLARQRDPGVPLPSLVACPATSSTPPGLTPLHDLPGPPAHSQQRLKLTTDRLRWQGVPRHLQRSASASQTPPLRSRLQQTLPSRPSPSSLLLFLQVGVEKLEQPEGLPAPQWPLQGQVACS